MSYRATIGLEIHAELKTQTKMFCGCLNDPNEKHPNVNICPICVGHPGTLPTVNKKALEAILKVGMSLNGDIPQFSKFDRKNYFYPDLPKGYQISQYDLPLIFGGALNGVRLRRIHLEEDTARLVHSANADFADESGQRGQEKIPRSQPKSAESASLADFNRAGVPLMELVTEPDITSVEQAVEFAKELQLILRYLGVSDADMEKGQLRIEANVSLRQATGDKELGTKVEVKNINSFKAVHDAIEYEIKRQEEVLREGRKVIQETRGWEERKKATASQRLKEEAHDYRYFPEPDLPPLDLSHFELSRIKQEIPELPGEKRVRFIKEFGLTPDQAEVAAADRGRAQYFEEVVSELGNKNVPLAFNYFTSDLFGLMADSGVDISELKIIPEDFAELIELIALNRISSRAAKTILKKMFDDGVDPHQILKEENLEQVSDEAALRQTAEKIIKENPTAVADYKKGRANALQFLVGKAMADLRGRGNPEVLQNLIKKLILYSS
jgi:aspartyl-tRNA(Asn)/glutamyl-tRNA(Gln) amidotransferase subunit B